MKFGVLFFYLTYLSYQFKTLRNQYLKSGARRKVILPFKLIEVEQGSKEWLELRRQNVTASDVPIIMGFSPYKTPAQLLEDKLFGAQEDFSKRALFAKGHAIEKETRDLLNRSGFNFKPIVAISLEVKDLLASLDGYELREDLSLNLEVKYVGKERLRNISSGQIPRDHFLQVQAQLIVTRAAYCYYVASTGVESISRRIDHSPEDQEQIRSAVIEFKKRMSGTNLVQLPVKRERKEVVDFLNVEDKRFEELHHLKYQIDKMTERFDFLKQELSTIYKEYSKVKGFGIKLTRTFRKGSIKYSDVPEIQSLDLEKYRGPEKEVISISIDEDYRPEVELIEEF